MTEDEYEDAVCDKLASFNRATEQAERTLGWQALAIAVVPFAIILIDCYF